MKSKALVLAVAVGVALVRPGQAAPAASDPWPAAPVLMRLFILPAGQASGKRLVSELQLSAAQQETLRQLAHSEAALGGQAQTVIGRSNAAALNRRIALFRAEKDRKARAALGAKYPKFRQWVRLWWASEVKNAGRA